MTMTEDDLDFAEEIPADFFDSPIRASASAVAAAPAPSDCPFPFDAFQGPAADLAAEIAENKDVPAELPFIAALGHAAAILGKGLRARNDHTGNVTGANLFIVVSAGTSSGKGESMDPFVVPFQAIQSDAIKRHRADVLATRLEKRGLDKTKSGLTPEQERRLVEIERKLELREPCLVHTSPTIEGLKAAMETWGECGFISSSEAGSFISVATGRYSDGKNIFSDLAGLYSATPVNDQRKGRGQSIILDKPCLSLCIAAQPDLFTKLRSDEAAHIGLLNRALWCIPSKPAITHYEIRRNAVSHRVIEDYAAFIRRGHTIYGDPSNNDGPSIVTIERDAGLHIARINYDMRVRIDGGLDSAEESGRRAELVTRVALGLHFMRHSTAAHQVRLQLSTVNDAERVIAWASHPFAGMESAKREESDAAMLSALVLAGAIIKPMTFRDLRRAIGQHRNAQGKTIAEDFIRRAMASGSIVLDGDRYRAVRKTP